MTENHGSPPRDLYISQQFKNSLVFKRALRRLISQHQKVNSTQINEILERYQPFFITTRSDLNSMVMYNPHIFYYSWCYFCSNTYENRKNKKKSFENIVIKPYTRHYRNVIIIINNSSRGQQIRTKKEKKKKKQSQNKSHTKKEKNTRNKRIHNIRPYKGNTILKHQYSKFEGKIPTRNCIAAIYGEQTQKSIQEKLKNIRQTPCDWSNQVNRSRKNNKTRKHHFTVRIKDCDRWKVVYPSIVQPQIRNSSRRK